MNKDMYQQLLLEHYHHPKNYGVLQDPDFESGHFHPSCGDQVSLQGIIKDNKLVDIKFTGKGCVISQAAASLLTEFAKGKTQEELYAIDEKIMQKLLGISLGPLRIHCALLSLQALHKGLSDFKVKNYVKSS